MKYMRYRDGEIFDEDKIYDVAAEDLDMDDIEEAARSFTFSYLWDHLSEEARQEIFEVATANMINDFFTEVGDEEDED